MTRGLRGTRRLAATAVAVGCATALAVIPTAASASSVVIPENTDFQDASGAYAGQSITVPPGTDNFLHTLRLDRVDWDAGGNKTSFKVYITSAAGDVPTVAPTGPFLFESAPVSIPHSGSVTVYPNITVTPGSQYAVFVDTEPPEPIFAGNSGAYSGGKYFRRDGDSNTWVPHPSLDIALRADFSAGQAATNAAVSCSPASVPVGGTSDCTVTASNAGTFTPPGDGGLVFMNTPGGGLAQCTLVAQTCTIPVVMSSGSGTFQAIAQYQGDATHLSSTSPAFDVTVTRRTTSTSVECTPATLKVGTSSTCTATVTDTEADGIPPHLTGTNISWTGPGLSSSLCSLSQSVPKVGTCSVQITPSGTGPQSVTADLGTNSTFATSNGSYLANAIKRLSTVTLTCTPAAPVGGLASTCTTKVEDLDPGTQTQPTGTVNLTKSGNGTLGATSCTVGAGGTCSVTYTPAAAGANTLTATYSGDSTHDGAASVASVTGSNPSLPPPSNPVSGAVEPVDPCGGVTTKLDRLTKKLKRQQSGAGDSAKKARKRAKIRQNIKRTIRRKAATGC